MKTHAAVDNLCVYGDPYKTYVVAIIVPSKVYLEMIGHNLGKDMCYDSLLNDKDVLQRVLKELSEHGYRNKLHKFEVPRAITFVQEEWTPESGLITASFKIKRKQISQKAITGSKFFRVSFLPVLLGHPSDRL